MIGRTLLVLTAIAGVGIGSVAARGGRSSLPYYRSATMTPEWLSDRDASRPAMHRVAAFRFSDQHGAGVTERDLDNRLTIVHFFFTRCGDVCPTTTSNLGTVLASVDDPRVQVLSYSVTPAADSAVALRAFAAEHHIVDSRWHLLTGAKADVEQLAKTSYFVRLGDGSTYGVASIAHTESVLLVDGCRRLRGVYAGTLALEMNRLREDIAVLSREPCTAE